MVIKLLELILWINVLIIFYAYIGFPLLSIFRGILLPKVHINDKKELKSISVCIAAYNEEDNIENKILNALQFDYPSSKWELIIASDGSTDKTNDIVRKFKDPRIKLLALPRKGKNGALNEAVRIATNEIIVFTDADTLLTNNTLHLLQSHFSDEKIGCVAGNFKYSGKLDKNLGEKSYWNFDILMKKFQSKSGSITSASGQIYAIRNKLFTQIPPGVVDDSFISLHIASKGYRLVFEELAIGTSPAVATSQKEYKRKARIMAQSFLGIWYFRKLFNPFKYGYYSLQLFSHKVLRRLVAFPLLLLLIITPFLWNSGAIYKIFFIGQFVMHLLALTGFIITQLNIKQGKYFILPFFLYLVNFASIMAAINFLKKRQTDIWVPIRT